MKCRKCNWEYLGCSASGVECLRCGATVPEDDWDSEDKKMVYWSRRIHYESYESSKERNTGANECPECGFPIWQVAEDSLTCPNCGVVVNFQGKTAWTRAMMFGKCDEGKCKVLEWFRHQGYLRKHRK